MNTINEILITIGLISLLAVVIGIRYCIRLRELKDEQSRKYMQPITVETNTERKEYTESTEE